MSDASRTWLVIWSTLSLVALAFFAGVLWL